MSPENLKPGPKPGGVSPIVNVRIPRADMEIIRAAARAQSLSYSTFIRTAAISAARQVNADAVSAS